MTAFHIAHTATNGRSQGPAVIDGHGIDYGLRHQSKQVRVRVARGLISGEINLGRLNKMQAAKLCRVPYAELGTEKPTKPLCTAKISAWWNGASADERVTLIRALGVTSVWDAISVILD